VGEKKFARNERYEWEFSELKIRITREDIENSGQKQRCESCLTERLLNKIENALSVMKNSLITTISCQITGIPKEWEEHGETTIQTIFKQHTGGAMEKKLQPEWNDWLADSLELARCLRANFIAAGSCL
jgi:hypothetical protein